MTSLQNQLQSEVLSPSQRQRINEQVDSIIKVIENLPFIQTQSMQHQIMTLKSRLQGITQHNNYSQRRSSHTETEENSQPRQNQTNQSSFGLINFKN